MKKPPIIEHINIPIPILFKRSEIKTTIFSICKRYHADDSFLLYTTVTFRQLLELSAGERLPVDAKEAITEFLKEEDLKQPVYLEEMYTFLKRSEWSINMSEISYMKVSAHSHGKYLFSVSKIKKKTDTETGRKSLILIVEEPYGSVKTEDCPKSYPAIQPVTPGCEEKFMSLDFKEEAALQEFMKNIILNGTVNLDAYDKTKC